MQELSSNDLKGLNLSQMSDLVVKMAHRMRALQEESRIQKTRADFFEKESRFDPLTKITNRRGFDHLSKKARADFENSFALIAIDLDKFKSINDTYGHDAGDAVLQHFAEMTKKTLRGSDFVSRFGGEEFVVLLPQSDNVGAVTVATKIAECLKENPLNYNGVSIPFTFSAGAVNWPPNETFESAAKRADDLLYEAKMNGRNQIKTNLGVLGFSLDRVAPVEHEAKRKLKC